MIIENIELLIEESEVIEEGYLSVLVSMILAKTTIIAGAPLGIGLGIIAVPVIYDLYKRYKRYREELKTITDKEKRKQIRSQMKDTKSKLEVAVNQEIVKQKTIRNNIKI